MGTGTPGIVQRLIIAFCLIAAFALTLTAARSKSPTYDEEFHLTRGYVLWKTGDMRLSVEHPPFLNRLCALPLLLFPEMRLPLDTPAWEQARIFDFAHLFLWEYNHDATRVVFMARFPVALLAILLGAYVYRWAAELYGARAGLMALGLYTFAPNILAHARLVTTDLGLTSFYFVASYFLWAFLQKREGKRLVAAGLTLGLALATKLSSLLLLPVSALVAGVFWLRRRPDAKHRRRLVSLGGSLLAIFGIGLATLWALYGFRIAPMEDGQIPLPATRYFESLVELSRHTEEGHHGFLMGRYSLTGWWYYFPVAFLIKTPLPVLLLLGLAVALGVLVRSRRDGLVVLIPPLALFATNVASSINIGYRHILPVLPFVFVLGGGAASWVSSWRHWLGWSIVALLGTWYVLGSLAVYPHYLSYFNELTGGPGQGYRYLVDSNLDWGQDLPGLKHYVDESGISEVKLAWFGTADPAYYEVHYDPLPSRSLPFKDEAKGRYETFFPSRPAPGVYAISATHLQGVYFENHDLYGWFREHEPVDRIGYSMFIYRVEPEGKGSVTLGLVDMALADVGPDAYARLDTNDVAVRWMGHDSLIFAPESQTVWLASSVEQKTIEFTSRLLKATAPVVERFTSTQGTKFTLRRLQPVADLEAEIRQLSLLSAAWHPSPPSSQVRFPVNFGDVVEFLGYERAAPSPVPGEMARWTIYWRVLASSSAPLKLFVHLLDGEGKVSAQQDVFTVPGGTWRSGDILIHSLAFQLPEDTEEGTYPVEIGWYEAEAGQRLVVYEGEKVTGDHLFLEPLEIEGSWRGE